MLFKTFFDGEKSNGAEEGREVIGGVEKENQFAMLKQFDVVLGEGLKHVDCFLYNLDGIEVAKVMAVIDGSG